MEQLPNQTFLWIGFNIFVFLLLALDLGVFNKEAHVIKFKEALGWTVFWIVLSLLFNVFVYYFEGSQKALEFLTGYLVEKSLSIDNIFVFLLVFSYFKVEQKYQHKVLFWGILGALVMRAIFIFTGIALIEKFHWIIYVFGAFLIFTGIKTATNKEDDEIHPEKNPVIKIFKNFMPVTPNYVEGAFFVKNKDDGKIWATPLFVVLLVLETTDVLFAVDSIPAILAITTDSFIVYSSNVMAILGLRALYFALAGIMGMFFYLKYGLSAILCFVGVKMLIGDFYKFSPAAALGVIGGILLTSILASVLRQKKQD
ncbi:TerC family protein [bacterium]|nr:TerC family protein [bacterium]